MTVKAVHGTLLAVKAVHGTLLAVKAVHGTLLAGISQQEPVASGWDFGLGLSELAGYAFRRINHGLFWKQHFRIMSL